MKINIVDTGVANLGSIVYSLEEIEANYVITDHTNFGSVDFSHIILPGVGSFAKGISNLKKFDFHKLLEKKVRTGTFTLGICLGMQLLFSNSEEDEWETEGLKLFNEKIKKLPSEETDYWPNIGWSSVEQVQSCALTKNIEYMEDFYFIHGYAADVSSYTVGKSQFGVEFSAIVQKENVFGVQFHPEKSQRAGLQLLKNFCNLK